MTDSSEDDDNQSLADDIVPNIAYEAPLPMAKEFLPWHRPRKQYVRQHQWCAQIGRLLQEHPLSDGTLKYLGLPGVDLLDIRHFHEDICSTRNVRFRFLGFNTNARSGSNAQIELNVSLDEIRKLPLVDEQSDVIGDNFSLLSKSNSIAWKRAQELGPFDVINLDLCDGFGAQAPGTLGNNYYNAVNNLLALQARYSRPWLLLLTTRTDATNVDSDVLKILIERYEANLASCPPFLDASRSKFNIDDVAKLHAASKTESGLVSVFLTGLSKWFVGLGLAQTPQTSVEVRSTIGYRVAVAATHADLVSLALQFTPVIAPVADPMQLATLSASPLDECILSTKALKRVANLVDADAKLADNHALKTQMINATAALLATARYDSDAYKLWAAST